MYNGRDQLQAAEARGEARGEAKGEARGKAKSVKLIATNMLKQNLDDELIIQVTGLSKKELAELKRK